MTDNGTYSRKEGTVEFFSPATLGAAVGLILTLYILLHQLQNNLRARETSHDAPTGLGHGI